MRSELTLPEPDASGQEHSQRLLDLILGEIRASGGFLPFRRYMEMALYQPGLGYYSAGARKFGAAGDFVTAPEISALFSQALARQCAQVLQALTGSACILEFGAGSGIMAADLLLELERLDCLPDHYYILEPSADLQQRQRQTLALQAPHLARSVRWLQALPESPLSGVILANEVLDAMPVELFCLTQGVVEQLGVGAEGDQLGWRARTADAALAQQVQSLAAAAEGPWPPGYRSELNPALAGWMASLASCLYQGAVLLIDYGYPRREYYHPQRLTGTLSGFYRHRSIEAPLLWPGLLDLTASVDFTAVAEAGEAAGLRFAGYTSQRSFLFANDLEALFQRACETNPGRALHFVQQIKTLTLPSEMGDRFQVIGFTNGLDSPLRGFALEDFSHRL